MHIDFIELERRIVIGFNNYLTLKERHNLITSNLSLSEISKQDKNFKLYLRETRDILHWLSKSSNNSIIWYQEPSFPHFEPYEQKLPYMIFCSGNKPDLKKNRVAIIGGSKASYRAIQQAFKMALEASLNDITVVSDFDEGVNQSAIKGSLSGNNLPIAILSNGHDVEYPSFSNELKEKIIEKGGCILSQMPCCEKPSKRGFLSKSILTAAYSNSIIIVQAPEKSLITNTVDYALQMGKEIYVASYGLEENNNALGTKNIVQMGSPVITSLDETGLVKGYYKKVLDVGALKVSEKKTIKYGDRQYVSN